MSFKASNGWLQNVCHICNMGFKTICDDSVNADLDSDEAWKTKLQVILKYYCSNNVCNVDETGLFYLVMITEHLLYKSMPVKKL